MKNLAQFLVLALCFLLAGAVSTFMFVGVGYVLSLVLPLSLFQCAFLATGATFVLVFVMSAVFVGSEISRWRQLLGYEEAEEEPDEDLEKDFDEEDDDMGDFADEKDVHERAPRVGRNAPCPCGSGLKYKRCCGKQRGPNSERA